MLSAVSAAIAALFSGYSNDVRRCSSARWRGMPQASMALFTIRMRRAVSGLPESSSFYAKFENFRKVSL